MACVFEVSNSEHGAQHHIYRLVKDWTGYLYREISVYTHTYVHTHTLHYRTTDCKPHHTGCYPGPPPGPTLTFLNPVRVNLFFSMCSCYHCSCEVVMQFLCIPQICKPQSLGEGESYQPKLSLSADLFHVVVENTEAEDWPWGIDCLYTNVFSSFRVFPT